MAQTAALRLYDDADTVDYTPGSAVAAGDVVVINNIPMIAPAAIVANVKGSLCRGGIWKVPQTAAIQTVGQDVFWDTDGTPVTGTAASGAASNDGTVGYYIGECVETTAATDSYVKVALGGRGRERRRPVYSVNAAGSAIGNAAAVVEGITIVAGADNTKAVILPVASAGMEVIVKSTAAGKFLQVFPQVNSAIDALGANNVYNSGTAASTDVFYAASATQWYSKT